MRVKAAFFGGLGLGALAGWTFGMLTAPKAGTQIRDDLAEVSDNIYRKAAYELEELADRVENIRHKLEDKQAVQEVAADFSPPVEKAVDKAQSALTNAERTRQQSHDVLERTQT